jgi:hypothetical protein
MIAGPPTPHHHYQFHQQHHHQPSPHLRLYLQGLVLLTGEGSIASQTANGDALVTSGIELASGEHYWEVVTHRLSRPPSTSTHYHPPLNLIVFHLDQVELLSESALNVGVCRPKLDPKGASLVTHFAPY